MGDPRLNDLAMRIRDAEKKFGAHIRSATASEMERQIKETGTATGRVYVSVIDGKHYVSPVYPREWA